MLNLLFVAIGVLLLTGGGEALIRGSLAAANRLGISPLLSGLLIVGFGTSAPELVVSIDAALSERPDIAIGNVVGSNISNIILILGLCALITPLAVKPLVLMRDGVTVVAASILFLVLVGGDALVRSDAAIFLLALAAYLIWAYWTERSGEAPSAEIHIAEGKEVASLPKNNSMDSHSGGAGFGPIGRRITSTVKGSRGNSRVAWCLRSRYRFDPGGGWHVTARAFDIGHRGIPPTCGCCYWQCSRQ